MKEELILLTAVSRALNVLCLVVEKQLKLNKLWKITLFGPRTGCLT